jgi:hypothetical protein
MKGGPPAPQLASEIAPTFDIENPGVESRFLLGWNRYGFGLQSAGAAGNPTIFSLRNPAGSNVLAVVESLIVSVNTLDTIAATYGKTNVDLTPAANPGALDGRAGTLTSSLVMSTSNAVAGGLLARFFLVTGAVNIGVQLIQQEHQEIPITPGFALRVETVLANNQLTVGLIWRERLIEESELK